MNSRWVVKGYEGSCQPQPDRIQTYDGGSVPPAAAVSHMCAMVEKDKSRTTCLFSEIQDKDWTIVVDQGLPTEYRTFGTVRAKER